MDSEIADDLKKDEQPALYTTLLEHCRQLMDESRSVMAQHYDAWDYADLTYRGKRKADKDDEEALKRNEPVKMTVPMTFAHIQSFIAFGFLLFMQNKDFFAHEGTGTEDKKGVRVADRFVNRDLLHNKWSTKLYQFILDTGRFGLGVFHTSFETEMQQVPVEYEADVVVEREGVPQSPTPKKKKKLSWRSMLKYQGNRIKNISPYRWFPDARLPLSEFQAGEFCGHEEEVSMAVLREWEAAGFVAGVDNIPPMDEAMWAKRGTTRSTFYKPRKEVKKGQNQTEGLVYLSKMVVRITPSKLEVDGKPLGEEDFPVKYVVWYANDQRVIKCEPFTSYHGEFPYSKAEFTPDMHQVINQGLPEVMDKLQSVLTWFINSHVTAVRRVIDNRLVIDPAGVEMESVRQRSPYILLKKNASKTGVERWVKQLAVSDTTGNHMNDSQQLERLIQTVIGINDNAQGQYNSGRRSATEARAVTAGAAGRLKTIFSVMWADGLEPMGRQCLTNARQSVDKETFERVMGPPNPADPMAVAEFEQSFASFKGTPEELIGGEDFFTWDATLASEKSFVAQSLQEFLVAAMSSPETAQMLDIDPKALFGQIMELRGITNLKSFSLRDRLMAEQAAGVTPIALPAPANGNPNNNRPAGGPAAATA